MNDQVVDDRHSYEDLEVSWCDALDISLEVSDNGPEFPGIREVDGVVEQGAEKRDKPDELGVFQPLLVLEDQRKCQGVLNKCVDSVSH